MPSFRLVIVTTLLQCVLGDHGFGSGRFFHTHFGPSVSPNRVDDEVEVKQLVDEVEMTSSDDLVQQLVDMMGDPSLSTDEDVLSATMIRFVEQPRFKFELTEDGRRQAKKIRVPGKLLHLLRSRLPMEEKKNRLDQVILRLMKKDDFEHPTLQIVEHGGSFAREFMFDTEDISDSQLRLPRARFLPSLRFQPTTTPLVATNNISKRKQKSLRKKTRGNSRPAAKAKKGGFQKKSNFEVVTKAELAKGVNFGQAETDRKGNGRKQKPQSSQRKSSPLTASNGEEPNVGFPTSYGLAGQDFPTYDHHNMPDTAFSCSGLVNGGLYADVSAQCQMYHMCVEQAGDMNKFSFLCPNGTLFSQETLSCSEWYKVDCTEGGIELLSQLLDAWDQERQFITSGLEPSDPLQDYPWRYRDSDVRV